jgi:hypothetical protein
MTLYDKFQIPDRYVIGGQDYTVKVKETVQDEDGDGVFGLHDPITNTISIAKKFHLTNNFDHPLTRDQIINSFFHELFHSFNYMMNTEQDETIAQSFANFMCEFLKTAEYDSGHAGESSTEFRPFDQEY